MSIYPQIETLGDICRYHDREGGSRDALIFRQRETSYALLDQFSLQVPPTRAAFS